MNFGKKEVILSAVILALIAGILFFWNRKGANNEDFPEGTQWVCSDQACATGFTLTVKALSDHHAKHFGEPVPCPKCKKPAVRAQKCAHCGKIYVLPRNENKCPQCGKLNTAKTE